MRYLLDTGVFLWSLHSVEKLNSDSHRLLAERKDVYLSSVTSWEIVIKVGVGKLNLPKPPRDLLPEAMTKFSFHSLPITHAHTLEVETLPRHHKDPFDRLLIAQARAENLALMTADPICVKYPVEIFWCGR